MALTDLTIADARAGLRKKDFSAQELGAPGYRRAGERPRAFQEPGSAAGNGCDSRSAGLWIPRMRCRS